LYPANTGQTLTQNKRRKQMGKVTAHPGQLARLISLSGEAIALAQKGNRSPEQIEELNQAPQKSKDASSARPKPQQEQNPPPGILNAKRRTRCGGFIDDGGICPCGYDHDNKVDYRGCV